MFNYYYLNLKMPSDGESQNDSALSNSDRNSESSRSDQERPQVKKGPELTTPTDEIAKQYGISPDHPLLQPAYIERYKQLFLNYDEDESGQIDIGELERMLKEIGQMVKPDQLVKLFKEFDVDDSGAIDFEEFICIFVKILGQKDKNEEEEDDVTSDDSEETAARKGQFAKIQSKEFLYDKGINWQLLHEHVDETHPRQNEKEEIIDEKLGEFTRKKKFGCCCSQIGQLAIGKEALELTDLELEVGIGLTMYFRQVKLFMIIFFLMMLFSAPLQYYSYQAYEYADEGEMGLVDYIKDRLLFRFSIATFGLMDFHCQEVKLSDLHENFSPGPDILKNATEGGEPAEYGPDPVNITNLHINCQIGTIQRLVEVGLSTWDSRCPSVTADDSSRQQELIDIVSIDEDCSYRNMDEKSSQFLNIQAAFNEIVNKKTDVFPLNLDTMFTKSCKNRILRLNQMAKDSSKFGWDPGMFIMVQCYQDKFMNPLTNQPDVDRQYLLYLTILTDCANVFIYMIAIVFIEKTVIRSIQEFKEYKKELNIKDFAIQVKNLPPISEYKSEQVLKGMLMAHFERIVSGQEQQIKQIQKHQKYQNQIIDVSFVKLDYGPIVKLREIKDKFMEISYLYTYNKNTGSKDNYRIKKVYSQIDSISEQFFQSQNSFYDNDNSVQSLKKKLTYRGEENIQMAIIVFRSMEGQARALNAYRKFETTLQHSIYNIICCPFTLCKSKTISKIANVEDFELVKEREYFREQAEEKLKFMNNFDLIVEPASEPKHIMWENWSQRPCCKVFPFCSVFLYLAIILGVFFVTTMFVQQFELEFPDYEPQLAMPPKFQSQVPNMTHAMDDFVNGTIRFASSQYIREKIGLVNQYCHYMTEVNGTDPKYVLFSDYEFYCVQVAAFKDMRTFIMPAIAVAVTVVSLLMFNCIKAMINCYSHKTFVDLYKSQIKCVTFSVYIAIAIIPLIHSIRIPSFVNLIQSDIDLDSITSLLPVEVPISGNYSLKEYSGFLPILQGNHKDIDIEWYMSTGQIICFIILFIVLFSQLDMYCRICCRSCKMSCDKIECCLCCRQTHGTCKKTQYDLKNLYTGEEFGIASNYSKYHIIIWISMSFSTTMPILYVLGFLFFFIHYYLDKYQVTQYNRKPTTFNEIIAQDQVWMFKWPIIVHVVFSVISLSNNFIFFESKLQSDHLGLNMATLQQIPMSDRINQTMPDLGPVSRQIVPSPQDTVQRYFSLHMILMYLFWIAVVLIYIFQEKLENCIEVICAKCRGDGEYEDYDSEAEEQEIHYEETHCKECEKREAERLAYRQTIRAKINSSFIDNNVVSDILSDNTREQQKLKKQNQRYEDSSGEESVKLGGPVVSDSDEQREIQEQEGEGNQLISDLYSDDFLREISLDYLFYYYDKNNFELQKTIQTLTNGHLFNSQYNKQLFNRGACGKCCCCLMYYMSCFCIFGSIFCGWGLCSMCPCWQPKPASDYVGTSYRQVHLKKLIGLFKRRKNTFQRRFKAIMKKMNHRVIMYLNFEKMGFGVKDNKNNSKDEINNQSSPFDEQLNLLRRIHLKKEVNYNKNEVEDKQIQTLSLNSWKQKQILMAHEKKCRIKQEIQSYDILDQHSFRGTMALLKMYLKQGKVRSDMHVVVNKNANHISSESESDVPEEKEEQKPIEVTEQQLNDKKNQEIELQTSKDQLLE